MMKDVLNDVDSDGSTLLHLAVDSGSSEVNNAQPFTCINGSFGIHATNFNLFFSFPLKMVQLCLHYGAIIRQPKVLD